MNISKRSSFVLLNVLLLCSPFLSPRAGAAADIKAAFKGKALPPDARQMLWYPRPAQKWTEALPIGNGRLGAMVFGGVTRDQIQFNEDSVWTGHPHDYSHKGAVKHLPEIRRLLREGKRKEAEQLAMREFMSVPLRQKTYQPCGDLFIEFPEHREVQHYRRWLDLDTACVRTEYQHDGALFQREVFASYPDQLLVMQLTADLPGKQDCDLRLGSAHKAAKFSVEPDGSLLLQGEVETDGVRFEARCRVQVEGGTTERMADRLQIRAADRVTIQLAAASNVESWKSLAADPSARCAKALSASEGKPYDALRERHVVDHRSLYRRVSLDLGRGPRSGAPTPERIAKFAEGGDADLAVLTFQYGRYLLIACSREGGQPANLQGLWNDSLRPPWDSKYTCNINTEMNYWPSQVAALAECNEPLFDALAELMESGKVTAREQYGAKGWVLNHNFDLWRGTAPINNSNHGIWPTGGAWLCTHLWEQYLFTRDLDFLRKTAYPLMRDSALFFSEVLIDGPDGVGLISSPSNSPEQGGLVAGPTMDHQIIRELYRGCIEAAARLKIEDDLIPTLQEQLPRIAPNKIGQHGQLQEWIEDKDNPSNKHRHVSHLWGVYPGADITWQQHPELFKAARQSLIYRGDAATGWSMGWKVNLWARFLDGNHALLILNNLLAPVGSKGRGGMYPNLFDAHPPFQIDGNFGACSGIAEMLLQSHLRDDAGNPIIHILPALPDVWGKGSVKGLKARGDVTVDISWKDGKLTELTLLAGPRSSGSVSLLYGDKPLDKKLKPGKRLVLKAGDFR